MVRLPHPRSGNSQSQETFLTPSADKQTRNYDTECSNHHLFLSTLRPKRLNRRKMKWWVIHTNLPVDTIVRLPHPRSGDSQSQETFLAPSAKNVSFQIFFSITLHVGKFNIILAKVLHIYKFIKEVLHFGRSPCNFWVFLNSWKTRSFGL